MGDDYVPSWELSRQERIRSHNVMREFGRRNMERYGGQEKIEVRRARADAELLERRRRVEAESGEPVAFLVPFDLAVLREWLPNGRPNPRYDPRITVGELVPVYADGTASDPGLYPVSGPF